MSFTNEAKSIGFNLFEKHSLAVAMTARWQRNMWRVTAPPQAFSRRGGSWLCWSSQLLLTYCIQAACLDQSHLVTLETRYVAILPAGSRGAAALLTSLFLFLELTACFEENEAFRLVDVGRRTGRGRCRRAQRGGRLLARGMRGEVEEGRHIVHALHRNPWWWHQVWLQVCWHSNHYKI